jgi:hypothetical protein
LTGSVLTAAQTNITSVGQLTSLEVANDFTAGAASLFGAGVLKVDSTNNRVGIINGSPDVTLDVGSATDAVHVPTGTTAQRPTGAAGYFRYNSSLEQFEGYTTEWGSIGGGGGTNTFTTDSFTGDGSTAAYALSQTVSSEDNLLVFIEGVFQQQDAYSIATAGGVTTLTFSSAPANGNSILIYSVAAGVSGSNLNIDSMTGDGSDTTLTLSINPVNENNTQVFIDGVYQSKSNYSISGTTLTFSTAPPTGSAVEVMTMTQTDINVPVDGTITPAKIASGDFYFDTDTLHVDATNNRVGIGTSSPSEALTIASAGKVKASRSDNTRSLLLYTDNNAATVESDTDPLLLKSADRIQFETGGANERMRIDASGNVGIGCVPASGVRLDIRSNAAATLGDFRNASSTGYGLYVAAGDTDSQYAFRAADYQNNSLVTITGAGNLLVGETSSNPYGGLTTAHVFTGASSTGGAAPFGIYNSTGTANVPVLNLLSRDASTDTTNRFLQFYANVTSSTNTAMGGIVGNGASNVQFASISDVREKENITTISGSLSKITSLNPVEFDWINSGEHVNAGFVAQEVEQVFPEFVVENMASEGQEERKGLTGGMTGGIVAHLVKAIQEQQETITALTARIEQLENN